ncbi:ADP-ribosylglycohydrolase family protein [Embleya scabrispora]|uniref:ADP-ribosylglycohydrolase family protein n=1 Tax=Embleya scabrispora TaxID=159449 RepID=UPI0003689841|nr:ADP-ribosylglycohydrolase family protein [Embleya scabrispora]MYS80102.1 hydrolase [Streptomyces sp. SID5474]
MNHSRPHRTRRVANAARALHGLALGDAFGEQWFSYKGAEATQRQARRIAPEAELWYWTDDTAMALSVLRVLHLCDDVDQDALAAHFAASYTADPHRGYGPSMHGVLRAIHEGESWREVTRRQFEGQGSWGNGAAMRVAPLGAWHADEDLSYVAAEAERSAETTHAHPEATAGAVAVAIAAALATRGRDEPAPDPVEFLTEVAEHTPESDVAAGIRTASRLRADSSVRNAVSVLGNGTRISAPDTVPFALWTAAHHLDTLADALWETARGMGDVDTTCAITAGVVASRTGLADIHDSWLTAREPIPGWVDTGGVRPADRT